MIKIAVFISGRGSNLKAIIEAKEKGQLAFDIQCVVSNKKEAEGLKVANENNISTVIVQPEHFESELEYEKTIIKQLKNKRVEWIVLAGYMKIVGPTLLEEYQDHIVNIHPSLLPAFKGLNAQKQAFEYGVKVAGCSVHFVNNELDGACVLYNKGVDAS